MSTGRLYDLLPSVYRQRDAEQGEPLRALLGVIEDQLQALEEDIDGLYDNWFIETCAEWVAPYIGDLMGVRPLSDIASAAVSMRPYVANTLAYRRRKGTAAVLQQLARDVTGWQARAVEYFALLSTTQHFNHVRLQNARTPDLRNTSQLELLEGPFENAAHTADVRHIALRRGRYNIPNIGLFLWRLESYPITRGSARPVTDPPDADPPWRFAVHPLGIDAPLFNLPQTSAGISEVVQEVQVPAPLRRLPLFYELEARRLALAAGQTPDPVYFGDEPVLEVCFDASLTALPPENISICNLSEWRHPPIPASAVTAALSNAEDNGSGAIRVTTVAAHTFASGQAIVISGANGTVPVNGVWTITVASPTAFDLNGSRFRGAGTDSGDCIAGARLAIDPVLGRLALPANIHPARVQVSYSYGFSADVGGGPYDRLDSISRGLTAPVTWQRGVSQEADAVPEEIVGTLAEAVAQWNTQPPGTVGVIAIMDSRTYAESLTGAQHVRIPAGSRLAIIAADWPFTETPDLIPPRRRLPGQWAPEDRRPHLAGDLEAEGAAAADPGNLVVDGLLVEGTLRVLPGNLGALRVAHCTLAPGSGGLEVAESSTQGQQNTDLQVTLERAICGGIALPATVRTMGITDSIVDGAIAAPGADVSLERCTVLGAAAVRSVEASNSIFTGVLQAERRQTGCVRFCNFPPASRTPRSYRCQTSVSPAFLSIQYGDPRYCQLALTAPAEIRTGAEDGSEMGVFSSLKQPQREANLRSSLDEYMRFGLEAGIFYAT